MKNLDRGGLAIVLIGVPIVIATYLVFVIENASLTTTLMLIFLLSALTKLGHYFLNSQNKK